MIETFKNLRLTVLTESQHRNTCGYWFTVTESCRAHTAFATKAGLLMWMMERGLSASEAIPNAGTWADMKIIGEYRKNCHYHENEVEEFNSIIPLIKTRVMSNGDYVEGKITHDSDGIRTVHYLNPNVKTRRVFDHKESREMMR